MLKVLGLIALFITVGAIGTGIAALVSFLFGIVGAPGRIITMIRKGESAVAIVVGTLMIILAQSYTALVFAAAVVGSARVILENSAGITKWAFWILAVWIAVQPGIIATRSVMSARKPGELLGEVDSTATGIAATINLVGAITFAIFPSTVAWAWGWVPHIQVAK